jgi:hypothetical protein
VILGRPAGSLALLGLAVSVPALAQEPAADGPSAKVSPLLGQVLDRLSTGKRNRAPAQNGLFGRLAQQQPRTLQGPSGRPAQSGAMVPALGYAMEQLDPVSFAVLRPLPVAGSGARLRTGDVFVLQFSASLPGQVRLENVDATGNVADLGTYTVFVDQLNRIPREHGIRLQGQPGVERLRFYFYPCLPAEAGSKPWASEFEGKLPACASGPVAQGSGAAGYGNVAPRAMVNLPQPDTTLAFAGSNDYQPGEITLMEAQIRHEEQRP